MNNFNYTVKAGANSDYLLGSFEFDKKNIFDVNSQVFKT